MSDFPYGIRREQQGDSVRFASNDKKSWAPFVLLQTAYQAKTAVERLTANGQPMPIIDFQVKNGTVNRMIQDMYSLERRLDDTPSGELPTDYTRRRNILFGQMAKDIKAKRQYGVLSQMIEAVGNTDIPTSLKALFYTDITTLYLMVCEPPRFLVGTKGGDYWKEIDTSLGGQGIQSANLQDFALPYMTHMHLIGRRELVTVPKNVMFLDSIKNVTLPFPSSTVGDSLEDAYYRQRYIVPPEGAQIRFRNSGDLESLVLVQSGDNLLSKVATKRGEGFVWISLEEAKDLAPDSHPGLQDPVSPKGSWSRIVADSYRDLVTATEVSVTAHRRVKTATPNTGPHEYQIVDPGDEPQMIYIPRIVKLGQPNEPRLPYDGEPRPIKPHKVSGYRRKGQMTEKHEEDLRIWTEQTGIRVPNIPDGFTWVRPYITPKGIELAFKDLPQFIKRRIEEQLAQQVEI